MKHTLSRRSQTPPLLPAFGMALLIALAVMATPSRANDTSMKTDAGSDAHKTAAAQPAPPADAAAAAGAGQEAAEDFALQPLRVGDATAGLLAWQRSGEIASPTPRPIPGAIAYRSYERYLKSFEHPIPEYLNSSVKKAPSSSGH